VEQTMLDRLQTELKASMLAKDTARTAVLRMALTAYKNEAVAKGLGPQGTLKDEDAVAVVKRLIKSREDSVEQFNKAGYADRAAVEQAEITVLKNFLPAMLEGVQLENAVREAIQATGAASKKDMGAVMKALQAKHGASFDGRSASQLVQSLLP
jgi:uncharacterized protein YqeY